MKHRRVPRVGGGIKRGAADLLRILLVAVAVLAPSLVSPARAAADTPATDKVTIGFFINDIQDLDLATESFTADFYMWLRWRNPAIDPSTTIESMNSNAWQNTTSSATGGVSGKPLYDKPRDMPDGSKYMILRYQGVFSRRMNLEKFPFDTQNLLLVFEDALADLRRLEFVPDRKPVVAQTA